MKTGTQAQDPALGGQRLAFNSKTRWCASHAAMLCTCACSPHLQLLVACRQARETRAQAYECQSAVRTAYKRTPAARSRTEPDASPQASTHCVLETGSDLLLLDDRSQIHKARSDLNCTAPGIPTLTGPHCVALASHRERIEVLPAGISDDSCSSLDRAVCQRPRCGWHAQALVTCCGPASHTLMAASIPAWHVIQQGVVRPGHGRSI